MKLMLLHAWIFLLPKTKEPKHKNQFYLHLAYILSLPYHTSYYSSNLRGGKNNNPQTTFKKACKHFNNCPASNGDIPGISQLPSPAMTAAVLTYRRQIHLITHTTQPQNSCHCPHDEVPPLDTPLNRRYIFDLKPTKYSHNKVFVWLHTC